MKIAVPREIKNNEHRVALTPAGAHEFVNRGHEVFVEARAGAGSSIQGGCFVDPRPTTHDDPTYRVHESLQAALVLVQPRTPHD